MSNSKVAQCEATKCLERTITVRRELSMASVIWKEKGNVLNFFYCLTFLCFSFSFIYEYISISTISVFFYIFPVLSRLVWFFSSCLHFSLILFFLLRSVSINSVSFSFLLLKSVPLPLTLVCFSFFIFYCLVNFRVSLINETKNWNLFGDGSTGHEVSGMDETLESDVGVVLESGQKFVDHEVRVWLRVTDECVVLKLNKND